MSGHRQKGRACTGGKSWCACYEEGDPTEVHVHPLDDLVGHDLTEDCVCGPTPELIPLGHGDEQGDSWMYTHHSLDGREHTEIDPEADQ